MVKDSQVLLYDESPNSSLGKQKKYAGTPIADYALIVAGVRKAFVNCKI